MRKDIRLLAVALLGTIALFSCKKKDNSTNPTYSMTASINGVAYSSACVDTLFDSSLFVTGLSSSSSTAFPYVTFVLSNYTGKGTYTIDTTGNNTAQIDSAVQTADAISGTITVTGTSPITGTFSFTCSDGTKVTTGAFTTK